MLHVLCKAEWLPVWQATRRQRLIYVTLCVSRLYNARLALRNCVGAARSFGRWEHPLTVIGPARATGKQTTLKLLKAAAGQLSMCMPTLVVTALLFRLSEYLAAWILQHT
jgi:hypothetical protein